MSNLMLIENSSEPRKQFAEEVLSAAVQVEDQDIQPEDIVEECCLTACRLGLERYSLSALDLMHIIMRALLEIAEQDLRLPEIILDETGDQIAWPTNFNTSVMSEWHPQSSGTREILELAETIRLHVHKRLIGLHKTDSWTETYFDGLEESYDK